MGCCASAPMPSNDDKLIKACQTGDLDELRAALAAGASVDCTTPDDYGQKPLHLAGEHDQAEVMKELLARGASINAPTTMTGASPLLYAVMHGSMDCTRLLLDAGAEVNHKNKMGITPLHRAAEYERVACATLLLDKGADINVTNGDGQTPLAVAKEWFKDDMIKLLTDKGGK